MSWGFGRLQRSLAATFVAIALILSAFASQPLSVAVANGSPGCISSNDSPGDIFSSKMIHSLGTKAMKAKADGSDGLPAGRSLPSANCCDSYCAPAFILSSRSQSPVAIADGANLPMNLGPLRSAAKNSLKRPPREPASPILRA